MLDLHVLVRECTPIAQLRFRFPSYITYSTPRSILDYPNLLYKLFAVGETLRLTTLKIKSLPFPSREYYQKGCRKPSSTILKTWRTNQFETDTKDNGYTSQPLPFSIHTIITSLTLCKHLSLLQKFSLTISTNSRTSHAASQIPHIDSIRHFLSSQKLHTIPSSSVCDFTIRTYSYSSTNTPTQSWKPDKIFALKRDTEVLDTSQHSSPSQQ